MLSGVNESCFSCLYLLTYFSPTSILLSIMFGLYLYSQHSWNYRWEQWTQQLFPVHSKSGNTAKLNWICCSWKIGWSVPHVQYLNIPYTLMVIWSSTDTSQLASKCSLYLYNSVSKVYGPLSMWLIIISCFPSWDIGHQQTLSSCSGPCPIAPVVPGYNFSSWSLLPGHNTRYSCPLILCDSTSLVILSGQQAKSKEFFYFMW